MTVNHKVIIEKIGTAFLLTIVAYFTAYIFEVSYLRSYGISWQTSRVIISSLVVSFVATMSLSACLNPLVNLLFDVLNERKKSEVRKFIYGRVFEFVVVFVSFLFWSLVYSGRVDIQWLIIAALIMPITSVLAWILFQFRFRRPFKKMLVESLGDFNKHESRSSEPSEFEKSNIMQAYSVILITTTIIFLLSYAVGYWASSMLRPSRAFVLDNSRYAVIRDYDGMIVAKEIVNDRIGEKYMYIDSSQNKLVFYPIRVDKGIIQ